ncbi:PCMD domain-containing protein [Flavobacterium succinicans]|uniref:Putative glycoside hydrolase n=1 Tax=Flavobacterium succinicans TaxID=29536 RepID=A0A199XSX7_9FLAO|nr:PCMD domain-containing protein [Flavobacterium succinicans]OAZ04439.1 putative glycoside hydrolase [Flavobacterium succinicans]
MRTKLLFLTLISVVLSNCVSEDYFGNSDQKKILSFILTNQVGNTIIEESTGTISINVAATANIKQLKPKEIVLSTFAAISPSSEELLDFTNPVKYTVTAEDGSTKIYTVTVKQEGSEPQLENSSFDDWYMTPKNYYEPGKDANSIWSSGNAGATTLGNANVTPFTINGTNIAAKLVTQDMGSLAGFVSQRMAAGSMFTGKFELDVSNPINSAKFGIPFAARPKNFSVEYAYSPGTPYLDRKGQTLTTKDACDIYVLLENRNGTEVKRVATAWFRSEEKVINAFKTITIPLTYGELNSSFPAYQKPKNGLYANANEAVTHISVVFSSSFNGDQLEGGTNSTLLVNNFKLIY